MQKDKKVYWKSLEEWAGDPHVAELAEREFMSSPLQSEEGGFARREFLKLMGASLTLSATSCLRRPVQKIIPYANRPPEVIPGVASEYASSWSYAGEGAGLVIKTREGRPIHLKGNELHPLNGKGLMAKIHAQILDLYDPDRLKHPIKSDRRGGSEKMSWDEIDKIVNAHLQEGEVAILSSSLSSPSVEQLFEDFFQAFKGRHVVWDPCAPVDVVEAQYKSYNKRIVPHYRFDRAKYIVSINADFLGTYLQPAAFSKDYAKHRQPEKEMSRLVVFEPLMSLTGSNADIRYMIKPQHFIDVVMGLLSELIVHQKKTRFANNGTILRILEKYKNVPQLLGIGKEAFQKIAEGLWLNRGKALVIAGGGTTSLQVAVNFLNSALGNDGKTIDYQVPLVSYDHNKYKLDALLKDMNSGKIKTLIIHRLNPVYQLPQSEEFLSALKNVKLVLSTSGVLDETAKVSDYVIPDDHRFEKWGDLELLKGVYSIQQPTIRPLFDTRSLELSLMKWAGQLERGPKRLLDSESWHSYLRERWKERQRGSEDFEVFWNAFLQKGVVDTTLNEREKEHGAREANVAEIMHMPSPTRGQGDELVLYEKLGIGDGMFSNISWLQEFPDPVTKIVWDNYLNISPNKAQKLKAKEGDIVRVSTQSGEVLLPVHIQPGTHDDVVGVAIGYGRKTGRISAHVGTRVIHLAKTEGADGIPLKGLSLTGQRMALANTQGHHSMEGRPLIAHATLKDYLKNPSAGIHKHKVFSIWPKFKYKGYKWAMAIDLNSCTGCGSCVIACQSENNIPVVGKRYVLQGREMHWMRIDRYYSGEPSNPETIFQPMLCQHCDNAPCESVCPVLATVHSDEGLNEMVYNRCVGTRYCSNNCPYKVRRFNWFNYTATKENLLHKKMTSTRVLTPTERMQLNPDVTVRSRGVMEKCTFCVQRLHVAKQKAKDEKRQVKDGEAVTACQESCPTEAIVFGDMNDSSSRVAKAFKDARSFSVLEELNTVPSVRYKTRIKNTDKKLDNGSQHS